MFQYSQRGVVALFLALTILAFLLATILGATAILVGQMKVIRGMGNSVIAFYAANTGIEKMLFDFSPNHSGQIGNPPFNTSFKVEMVCSHILYPYCPLNFVIDPGCPAANFCIRSIGIFEGSRRAIEVTI